MKTSIYSYSKNDFKDLFIKIGLPESKSKYHAKQIMNWLYQRKVQSFAEMTDLSKLVRQHLEENFSIEPLPSVSEQLASD